MGLKSLRKVIFIHHPLLNDKNGLKLSKSESSISIKELRNKYSKPNYIYKLFAKWLNLKYSSINNLDDLKNSFNNLNFENFEI